MKLSERLMYQALNENSFRHSAKQFTGVDFMFHRTSTNVNTTRLPSLKEIMQQIQDAQDLLDQPPTIKVWIGDDKLISAWNRLEYPHIVLNECLNDDDCYIVAGCGVICGKSAYDKLWEYGYIAIWTDEAPK